MVYWVSFVTQTRQDIEKRFSVFLKGVENEAFPIKNWHLKFSYLSFAEFAIFAIFKIFIFFLIIFIGARPLCFQWYTVTFSVLTRLYAFL